MVLTYKMSRTTSNTTKMCSKCTNFIKTIKATKQFVVFLFVHSWEQRKLGDFAIKVTEKNTQNTVRETFTNSAEFGVVSQRDFFDHDISKADKIDGYYVVENDDFIYNPRISVTAPCGPINRNKLGRKGVMSPLYTVFRIDNIDALFLEWFFKSSCWYAYMYFNGDSGARSDRFSIKNELFFDMPIPTPNIDEQKRIGMLMDSLSDLITLHQCKCLDKLHALSILPCPLPSRKMTSFWEQRKFEDFFTERNERSGNGEMISVTIGSGIKKFDELNRFDKKPDDLSKYKKVEVGDIAYNSMRMWQGASGYSPYSGILSPAYTVITPKNGVSSRFFAYVLKRPKMIHQFEINSQGLTKDTWNLKFPAFAPIEVVAPKQFTEQEKVSGLLLQLDNLITLHQCKCLDKLHALSILPCPLPSRKMTSFWEQRKLGELFSFRYGDGNTNPSNGGQYPVFGAGGIQGGYTEFNAENSIIIGHMGDAGCVSWGDGKHFVTYNGTITKPKNDIFSSKFGYYLLLSMDLRKYRGGSGLPFLTYEMLTEMWTQIPKEKDETRLIAECFTYLDNLITLHQCKDFSLKSVFEYSKNFISPLRKNASWEQRKLGEVATITKGQQINKTKLGSNGTYYVLNGGMTPSGYTDSFNTEQGTISISEGGNSCGYVNYNYEPFWSGGHNYTLLSPKICTDYLYQMLKYIEPSIMALRVGSGLPNIQKSRLNEVNIVFPSKEEQRLIGDFFTDLDNLITLHQRQLEKLKNIKSALLEKMFV